MALSLTQQARVSPLVAVHPSQVKVPRCQPQLHSGDTAGGWLSAQPPTFCHYRKQSRGGSQATVQVQQTEDLVSRPQLHLHHSGENWPALTADTPGTEGKLSGPSPGPARSVRAPAAGMPDRGGSSL